MRDHDKRYLYQYKNGDREPMEIEVWAKTPEHALFLLSAFGFYKLDKKNLKEISRYELKVIE